MLADTFDIRRETFESTYNILNSEIVKLFKENWNSIMNGTTVGVRQQGSGSYHNKKDLEDLQKEISFSWGDIIEDFLSRLTKKHNDDKL